jgi:hypothetical protein
MSKVYFLHVDTTSTTANTVIKNNNGIDSFNCSIILGKEHRKLRRVALKSAEIPLGFFNIRAPYNTLTINIAGALQSYTFSPGNYNATTFLNTLNNTITPAVGSFFLNTLTNTIQYTSVVGASSIVGDPGTLGYFMGFQTTQVGVIIVAAKSYNIDFDNYICIYIENLRNSCMEPYACTFKIPITVQKGGVQNYLADSTFKQSIEIFDPNYRIDRLNIQVRDRFGNPLSNNGIDWSMTLEMESDT